MDAIHAVARKEEGLKSRREWEIPEHADIIVCEINCILVLSEEISSQQAEKAHEGLSQKVSTHASDS